jgi:hypothetical protein
VKPGRLAVDSKSIAAISDIGTQCRQGPTSSQQEETTDTVVGGEEP